MIEYRLNGQSVTREQALSRTADKGCKTICRDRRGPAPKTDTSFFAGFGTLSKQFEGDEAALERIVSSARASGYNPNADDVYQPGLAEYEGDPSAFVPREGARGHIRRVCEERGMACHGSVEVKGIAEERQAVDMADDLAERMTDKLITESPDLARVDRREVKSEAKKKFGGKK